MMELFSTTPEYNEIEGFIRFRKYLKNEEIDQILDYLRIALANTPLFTPKLKTGKKWSDIPEFLYKIIEIYFKLTNLKYNVKNYDSCLITLYKNGSSLGMHYDKDEKDLNFPITSISIGRPAKFDIELQGRNQSFTLFNGDIIIISGKSRNAKHGVSKLLTDIQRLGNPLKDLDSRLNLTFRKAL